MATNKYFNVKSKLQRNKILKLQISLLLYLCLILYQNTNGRRIYEGGVYHPPFDTLKICISTCDMKLKLYR